MISCYEISSDSPSEPRTFAGGQLGSETDFIRRTHPPVTGRVLIMDDDQLILEVVAAILETIGVEVVGVENGEQALHRFHAARAAGNPFHLIILDLVVPRGQGGKETLLQIRRVDPKARVIVSSGYASDGELMPENPFGFNASLPKPYRGADLLQLAFDYLPQKNHLPPSPCSQ